MEKDLTSVDSATQQQIDSEKARIAEEEKQSALMASIKEFGTNSVSITTLKSNSLLQYYYAHAPKNFNVEGAEIFKGDGLIYGGDPVKLGVREAVKKQEDKPAKKITKYSWIDEEAKVK